MTNLIVDKDYPALACGVDRHEGVVIAYVPHQEAMMMEHDYRDGDRHFIVYTLNSKVMDMLPMDNKPVKWWMVREAARQLHLDYIEPIKACAAEDFRLQSLPEVPQPPGTVLAFRQYSRGPWVTLNERTSDGRDDATNED